jgi:hypothetical protein
MRKLIYYFRKKKHAAYLFRKAFSNLLNKKVFLPIYYEKLKLKETEKGKQGILVLMLTQQQKKIQ